MNYESILEKITVKIQNNTHLMGKDLLEYPESTYGTYYNNKENCIHLSHIFSWTQSFHTGCVYWAYRISGDRELLKWLYSFYDEYYNKVNKTSMDTMQDLGFLYSPYAVALYKLTGDTNMKKLGLKAADVLAQRFVPKGNYIQAWGRMDGKLPQNISEELKQDVFFKSSTGRVIVDSMMNLPLLFWASEVSGHPYYSRIAQAHADTVLENFIRKDGSICHAFLFDEKTGEIICESNSCGFANGSHWACGTAWSIYGFAIAYAYTKNDKYLDAAIFLCEKFIDECKGEMPVWDFRLPLSEPHNIDTSAVAVVLCGINEMLKHRENLKLKAFMESFEEKLLEYVNIDENISGILTEQNGRKVYASYGDYYFMEYFCTKKLNAERIW